MVRSQGVIVVPLCGVDIAVLSLLVAVDFVLLALLLRGGVHCLTLTRYIITHSWAVFVTLPIVWPLRVL